MASASTLAMLLVLGVLVASGCSHVGVPEGHYEGYGDYSNTSYFDLDPRQVTQAVVQCARDNGINVVLLSTGDGFSYGNLTPAQEVKADAVVDACTAALHLPDDVSPTDSQFEELYAYEVALVGCIETQGYHVDNPPSVEAFVNDNGSWTSYEHIQEDVSISSLTHVCPRQPVGGFGAWDPGDPVLPLP
ncbi:hypothetical protein BMS3Abin02_01185 [bacterium BMS3Abin02]|nr:hypothetical protein BMS3Abin02_01185 [bacterium BMS3Abin02]GBE20910.1 hypothetical protein BMS3Bbin01_00251 [bacterium BMS3Bbin01]